MSVTIAPRNPEPQDPDASDAEVVEGEDAEQLIEDEDMDEYQAVTQRLERDTDKTLYDPAQDKAERRTIRQKYRELIRSAEGTFLHCRF
jgi:hypothetical protein